MISTSDGGRILGFVALLKKLAPQPGERAMGAGDMTADIRGTN
ncbi:MAG: hypothetical protein R3C09_05670 [Pirellulaceae bacterium]